MLDYRQGADFKVIEEGSGCDVSGTQERVCKDCGVTDRQSVEPKDLSDAFNLTINVPNSDGKYEKFTYTM